MYVAAIVRPFQLDDNGNVVELGRFTARDIDVDHVNDNYVKLVIDRSYMLTTLRNKIYNEFGCRRCTNRYVFFEAISLTDPTEIKSLLLFNARWTHCSSSTISWLNEKSMSTEREGHWEGSALERPQPAIMEILQACPGDDLDRRVVLPARERVVSL